MKKYIFIGTGGFLGAALRYFLKNIRIFNLTTNLPLNTLMINGIGCFIIGLFLTAAYEVFGVSTGFVGAFTTFSTLCKETVALVLKGQYYSGALYIMLSAVFGLAAVYFGITIAREVIAKAFNKNSEISEEN